ncbi:MAG TPA: BtrH N-terminal domain-containing protein [Spirochaetota bacterium]|nr:BtrH N-terminal domain-containing protein [Spirochaetota bacterium]
MTFQHKMAAHCESGTVAALLNHAGLSISEPLVFGISAGIFFGYFESKKFPFPTFVVRNRPGQIRTGVARRTGVRFKERRFRNPEKGERVLDDLLSGGKPVACQTDFFYMKYLPDHVRVHINVHFITVVEKRGDVYVVSDCYSPNLAELDRESLMKARFAGGSFSPRGFIFHPVSIPRRIDYRTAIWKGIASAAFNMVRLPIPFIGVKGIRFFAKKVVDWPSLARDIDHLSHEIMKINIFLEDQGTGGAGFRFMYATFLREASELLNDPDLLEMSKRIMEIGDRWREISLFAARIGKRRDLGPDRLGELSAMIYERADAEERFFNDLLKLSKSKK